MGELPGAADPGSRAATTNPEHKSFMDGWLRTGDVATIDAEATSDYGRTKDLVKRRRRMDARALISKTPSWRIRRWPEAAVVGVFPYIPSSKSVRWHPRAALPEYRDQIASRRSSISWRNAWPSGGCLMMSCSSKPCRRRASANSTNALRERIKITNCPRPDGIEDYIEMTLPGDRWRRIVDSLVSEVVQPVTQIEVINLREEDWAGIEKC